jgi:hypothetical protein
VVHFQLLSTWGYRPDAVTFGYWPFSVGQVRDFHPAVPVRSQAHEPRAIRAFQKYFPKLERDRAAARKKLKNANANS